MDNCFIKRLNDIYYLLSHFCLLQASRYVNQISVHSEVVNFLYLKSETTINVYDTWINASLEKDIFINLVEMVSRFL